MLFFVLTAIFVLRRSCTLKEFLGECLGWLWFLVYYLFDFSFVDVCDNATDMWDLFAAEFGENEDNVTEVGTVVPLFFSQFISYFLKKCGYSNGKYRHDDGYFLYPTCTPFPRKLFSATYRHHRINVFEPNDRIAGYVFLFFKFQGIKAHKFNVFSNTVASTGNRKLAKLLFLSLFRKNNDQSVFFYNTHFANYSYSWFTHVFFRKKYSELLRLAEKYFFEDGAFYRIKRVRVRPWRVSFSLKRERSLLQQELVFSFLHSFRNVKPKFGWSTSISLKRRPNFFSYEVKYRPRIVRINNQYYRKVIDPKKRLLKTRFFKDRQLRYKWQYMPVFEEDVEDGRTGTGDGNWHYTANLITMHVKWGRPGAVVDKLDKRTSRNKLVDYRRLRLLTDLRDYHDPVKTLKMIKVKNHVRWKKSLVEGRHVEKSTLLKYLTRKRAFLTENRDPVDVSEFGQYSREVGVFSRSRRFRRLWRKHRFPGFVIKYDTHANNMVAFRFLFWLNRRNPRKRAASGGFLMRQRLLAFQKSLGYSSFLAFKSRRLDSRHSTGFQKYFNLYYPNLNVYKAIENKGYGLRNNCPEVFCFRKLMLLRINKILVYNNNSLSKSQHIKAFTDFEGIIDTKRVGTGMDSCLYTNGRFQPESLDFDVYYHNPWELYKSGAFSKQRRHNSFASKDDFLSQDEGFLFYRNVGWYRNLFDTAFRDNLFFRSRVAYDMVNIPSWDLFTAGQTSYSFFCFYANHAMSEFLNRRAFYWRDKLLYPVFHLYQLFMKEFFTIEDTSDRAEEFQAYSDFFSHCRGENDPWVNFLFSLKSFYQGSKYRFRRQQVMRRVNRSVGLPRLLYFGGIQSYGNLRVNRFNGRNRNRMSFFRYRKRPLTCRTWNALNGSKHIDKLYFRMPYSVAGSIPLKAPRIVPVARPVLFTKSRAYYNALQYRPVIKLKVPVRDFITQTKMRVFSFDDQTTESVPLGNFYRRFNRLSKTNYDTDLVSYSNKLTRLFGTGRSFFDYGQDTIGLYFSDFLTKRNWFSVKVRKKGKSLGRRRKVKRKRRVASRKRIFSFLSTSKRKAYVRKFKKKKKAASIVRYNNELTVKGKEREPIIVDTERLFHGSFFYTLVSNFDDLRRAVFRFYRRTKKKWFRFLKNIQKNVSLIINWDGDMTYLRQKMGIVTKTVKAVDVLTNKQFTLGARDDWFLGDEVCLGDLSTSFEKMRHFNGGRRVCKVGSVWPSGFMDLFPWFKYRRRYKLFGTPSVQYDGRISYFPKFYFISYNDMRVLRHERFLRKNPANGSVYDSLFSVESLAGARRDYDGRFQANLHDLKLRKKRGVFPKPKYGPTRKALNYHSLFCRLKKFEILYRRVNPLVLEDGSVFLKPGSSEDSGYFAPPFMVLQRRFLRFIKPSHSLGSLIRPRSNYYAYRLRKHNPPDKILVFQRLHRKNMFGQFWIYGDAFVRRAKIKHEFRQYFGFASRHANPVRDSTGRPWRFNKRLKLFGLSDIRVQTDVFDGVFGSLSSLESVETSGLDISTYRNKFNSRYNFPHRLVIIDKNYLVNRRKNLPRSIYSDALYINHSFKSRYVPSVINRFLLMDKVARKSILYVFNFRHRSLLKDSYANITWQQWRRIGLSSFKKTSFLLNSSRFRRQAIRRRLRAAKKR